MKKQSKMILISMGGILIAAAIAVTAVFLAFAVDGKKYQKHMGAAQKYLDVLQYEQAIVEYVLAIERKPKNVEAYQALAELYVQMEDYGSAIAVLNQGIEQTDSGRLKNYLEKVQTEWEEKKGQTVQGQPGQNETEEDMEQAEEANSLYEMGRVCLYVWSGRTCG